MKVAETVLKKYWSHESFRPLQAEIIQNVLEKKATLALLPTGGGKSICFQIPGILLEGLCLVVSPLVALMKDQVMQLQKRGIKAEAIHSALSFRETALIYERAALGEIKFLYVSPERLKNTEFLSRMPYFNINLVAVDEAHCISKWGHDFRPAYEEIGDFISSLKNVNAIALTATATQKVQKDIIEKLQLKDCQVFTKSFARDNLSFEVIKTTGKLEKCIEILNKQKGSAIIYVKTRKVALEFTQFLQKNGISADYYHAGISMADRNLKQDKWIANEIQVIIATNAFGMGIDKHDVRVVIHTHLCENLEAYYQEAGRAGRDGKPAKAILISNEADIAIIQKNLELKYPSSENLQNLYQKLANFFQIAVNNEQMQATEFEFNNFCTTYGLPVLETHYSFQMLKNQNLIEVNEAFFNHPKLHFLFKGNKLAEFQEKNPQCDNFIKNILRIYGGEIFGNYINIVEKEIAIASRISLDDCKNMLTKLHKLEVIDYVPQTTLPTFRFLGRRQDAEKLQINYKLIAERKNFDRTALEAMISFAQEKHKCRMLMIQHYFDERATSRCKVCDNCKKLLQLELEPQILEELEKQLESILPASIDKIMQLPQMKALNDPSHFLKNLMQNGYLSIDAYGLLYKK
jgi:ATP-dependent DNA helicase RecQ